MGIQYNSGTMGLIFLCVLHRVRSKNKMELDRLFFQYGSPDVETERFTAEVIMCHMALATQQCVPSLCHYQR